jgi:hypothetical protein
LRPIEHRKASFCALKIILGPFRRALLVMIQACLANAGLQETEEYLLKAIQLYEVLLPET